MKPLKNAVYRASTWLLQETPVRSIVFALYRITNNSGSADPMRNGEDKVLRMLAKDISLFIDAGANRGDVTSRLLELNPSIRAVCFEPTPELVTNLQNRFPHTTIEASALGDTVGTVSLSVYGNTSPLNSLYARTARPLREERTLSVPITSLDAYAKSAGITSVDFIKIDVEGAELAVLRGARELLVARAIRYIQFEYGDTWIDARVFLKDLFEYMDSVGGYTLYRITPGGLLPVPTYTATLEQFMYQNYLLVRTSDDPFLHTKTQ